MRYYVYLLCYPDGIPFYVGKGSKTTGMDRIDWHEAEARGEVPLSNRFKVHVIQKIWREGGEVMKRKIALFEDEKDALTLERMMILGLREQGIRLTNLTQGGEGATYPRKPLPPEFGENVRKMRTGMKHSLEARLKISEGNRRRVPPAAKTWHGFVSPDGVVYRNVFSLCAFCREHGLSDSAMRDVAYGDARSHKGWTLLRDEGSSAPPKKAGGRVKIWDGFVSPDGVVYRNVRDLHAFCIEHGLTRSAMCNVAYGERPHHKGWTLLKE